MLDLDYRMSKTHSNDFIVTKHSKLLEGHTLLDLALLKGEKKKRKLFMEDVAFLYSLFQEQFPKSSKY